MELPTTFNGIEISSTSPDDAPEKLRVYTGKHYEITTNDEKFIVVAGNLKVYENDLSFSESSLGVLEYEGRDSELIQQVSSPALPTN